MERKKAHLVVSFIKTQEKADWIRSECFRLAHSPEQAEEAEKICRKACDLQKKANMLKQEYDDL
jgi:hypothetical protein